MKLGRPSSTMAFRGRYQQQFLPAGYHGLRHLLLVLATGITLIVSLNTLVPHAFGVGTAVWVPITLLVANFFEYWVHRGPMHRPVWPLRPMFERHARRHHRYFSLGHMEITAHRDLHAVLFPPVLFLFFAMIATGLGALIALIVSREAATVFVSSAVAYYLAYEILHLLYHLPRVEYIPIVRDLARLHRKHHYAQRKQLRNFNLVFPLFDWVHGTLDGSRDPAHDWRSSLPFVVSACTGGFQRAAESDQSGDRSRMGHSKQVDADR